MSETKDLIVKDLNEYPSLVEGSDLRETMLANMGGAEIAFEEADLNRVKTPLGGLTKWTVNEATGPQTYDRVEGICVYYSVRGTLWPTAELGEDGQLPLLVTNDLASARKVGDDFGDIDPEVLERYRKPDGSYDWKRLPWQEWNTGKDGVGKRCRESRVIMLLRKGEAFPLMFQAQPGSLPPVRRFFANLKKPFYHWVVSLGLVKEKSRKRGVPYSQIDPIVTAQLPKEFAEKVFEMYTKPLSVLSQGLLDIDTQRGGEGDEDE